MSLETVIRPTRGPARHRAAERRRSPLGEFLSGAALIFDFTGSHTWRHVSTMQYPSDADALGADWDAVGDDMRWAMDRHPSNQPAP